MDKILITCGNCESRKRVGGDNKQYLICLKTNRQLPDENLDKYIDCDCPLYKSDIHKANDSKFTLKTIIFMTVILILSLMIFYIFGF